MEETKKMEGRVVLMIKKVLEFTDFNESMIANVHQLLGNRVSLQLISSVHADSSNGLRGKVGKPAYLEAWNGAGTPLATGESAFKVTFNWEEDINVPGAFIIQNLYDTEIFLKNLTLEDVPGQGRIHFVCDSWVYPSHRYDYERIFFVNKTYVPSEMPEPLRKYREEELAKLRGNGTGQLEEWDRVYDYAYYNDLGDPDKGSKYARPVLGGSTEYPYPRRGRTGRKVTKKDSKTESKSGSDIYVPRDERFGHLKKSDFLGLELKAAVHLVVPEVQGVFDATPNDFDTYQDVLNLYEGVTHVPQNDLLHKLKGTIPYIYQLLLNAKFPLPEVIKDDESAWRTDKEFAREMLAGENPVLIRCLQEFPPTSKLDPKVYGNHTSSITKQHIENGLNGLTIDEALKKSKLFILEHHDALMPYMRRINATSAKSYATRTLLLLNEDGALKPLAIELSLPHPDGDKYGVVSEVFTPAKDGVEGSIWELAKAYVVVNDTGVHELISHWLNTHASVEPFVIATNRQLSVVHPIHKLLRPHFRDTMNINAFARQVLISAGGIIETSFSPTKYAMEMSSAFYKNWVFTEQALPADLLKRGIAVPDPNSPHGLRLLIEDYPYAVDGLEIWSAIETWVHDYCSYYYPTDDLITKDHELQSWWAELKNVGHGDKKDEPWWPKMHTLEELTQTCTIVIWMASALHAAVNFGQYPYGGYHPNRATMSRRLMPEPGTPEYEELKSNPEKVFFKTITGEVESLLVMSIIEILSTHSSDEIYLGQRSSPEWTTDETPLKAFESFGMKLEKIEEKISAMNNDSRLKNRVGPVKIPYTLLYPNTSDHSGVGGITGKGIPNSVSI